MKKPSSVTNFLEKNRKKLIKEIEYWNNKIKVIENMKLFKQHKKRYPIQKRVGIRCDEGLSGHIDEF